MTMVPERVKGPDLRSIVLVSNADQPQNGGGPQRSHQSCQWAHLLFGVEPAMKLVIAVRRFRPKPASWLRWLACVFLGLCPLACQRTPPLPPSSALPKWFDGPESKVDLLFMRLDGNLQTMSQRDRFVWIIDWYHIELENGGTDQVFYNSTGGQIAEAIEAFELIGARDSAEVLRRVCALFPDGKPAIEDEARREQMAAIRETDPEAFRRFDGQWFEDDVFQRLIDYWKTHEPAEETSQPDQRRKKVTDLFLDLPLVKREDYPKLSRRQQFLWETCFFATLAQTDGLSEGYFVNLYAQHYPTLLAGLEEIGAKRTVALLHTIGEVSSDPLADHHELARKSRQAFSGIQVQEGVVKGSDWQEDLYELMLEFWNTHE